MIDVEHQISAVSREVGERVLAAGQARVVRLSQTYRATLDEVWDACTNPERIPRWFLPISGDLRLGGRYALQGNAEGVVQTCDAPNGFTATWEFGGDVSWIEVRLRSVGEDSTRFELEHIAHVDDERWAEFGPGAVGLGWDGAVLGLANHLATGESVDPEAAMAWMMSAEGIKLYTLGSRKWMEAQIAAGADAQAAQEAAARTLTAYTGIPAAG